MKRRLVAVLPAAGSATRLGELGGSKEALELSPGSGPIIGHALRGAAQAGAERVCVVTRESKTDLIDVLGDGAAFGVPVEVHTTAPTPSAVHTLCVALRGLGDVDVMLAYPDLLVRPANAFLEVARRHGRSPADVTLAVLPSQRPDKADMVRLDADGRPVELVIKDPSCALRYTWGLAVWGPRFTELLVRRADARSGGERELYVGDVLRESIERGFTLDAVRFEDGVVVDVGTPGDLERARTLHWD
ncbi:MAG: sugar phosphate nucleotidyltransferase [Acidobacteriota bacterium]